MWWNATGRLRTVIAALTQHKRTGLVDPERLSVMWGIGIHAAQKTLEATTQDGVRLSVGPIHRRFKTKQAHLRYPILNTAFYSDTLFANLAGVGGDTCGQV